MDAIRGLVQPGFVAPSGTYYPYNGWTLANPAPDEVVDAADNNAPMVEVLTNVSQNDPRFGPYPILNPDKEEPGPPKPTYQELEFANQQLTVQNQQLTQENADLEGQVTTLTEANTALQGQVDTLTQQNTDLQGQVDSLTAQLADCLQHVEPASASSEESGSPEQATEATGSSEPSKKQKEPDKGRGKEA